ncbi:uncharacterized protein EAF01_001208 [Botrytis porri]|uniref:uncharacterized protein n=1 Tax=Botrytis porri TaxID=87229 RepID=UPI00190184F2|nr:uncharacterized protein EAF01_001208 [Botrytis porri]KAF7912187.1 hypothetical protein EAF01_001208 [Botrytis porri]
MLRVKKGKELQEYNVNNVKHVSQIDHSRFSPGHMKPKDYCLTKPYKIPPQARASTSSTPIITQLYSAIDDPAARNLQDEMIGERKIKRRTSTPCLQ